MLSLALPLQYSGPSLYDITINVDPLTCGGKSIIRTIIRIYSLRLLLGFYSLGHLLRQLSQPCIWDTY